MDVIINWFLNNYFEIIAFLTGVAGVWLTAKQNIWCWLIGLVNILFSAIVFYTAHLYAAVILQFFYLVTTVYGWYKWKKGAGDNTPLPVIKLTNREILLLPLIMIILVFVAGFLLERYTDASLPYFDSFTTVGGIICTFLAARKVIESWLIWTVIDSFSVCIFLYKGLYIFVALYLMFCVLAVYGYFQWKRDLISVR